MSMMFALRAGLLLVVSSALALGCAAETDDDVMSGSSEDTQAVSDELSTSGPEYQPGTELTTSANLNLRNAQSTTATVLVVMPRGSALVVTQKSGGNAWVAVRFGKYEGWAHTDYLMDNDEEEVSSGSPTSSDVNCNGGREAAYEGGRQTGTLQLMRIGSKKATYATGHAFLDLRQKMAARGVTISLNSGFRTQAEQEYFWNCYQTGRCNNGNLAARPGYSNHQNGRAVDISISNHTRFRQVLGELGLTSRWRNTVASERWHWEYFGNDPGGMCN